MLGARQPVLDAISPTGSAEGLGKSIKARLAGVGELDAVTGRDGVGIFPAP